MIKRLVYATIAAAFIAIAGIGIVSYLRGVLAPQFDAQDMTLNYERLGHGPRRVVLLHGLTGSLNYWKTGLQYAPDSYSFLLVDLLGFGDSPKPNSRYDLDEHVAAISKVLEIEGFDSGDVVVVGHSLGAILTMALVAQHPQWFEAQVVIGLPNYKNREEFQAQFARISLWDKVSVDSSYEFVCYFHPIFMTEWFRPDDIPRDIFVDAKKHTWLSYYRTLDEVVVNSDLRALARKTRGKKTLLIHGEEDTAAPIRNVAALVPLFADATFSRLAGEGHQLYLSNPKRTWELIEEFLQTGDRDVDDTGENRP